MRTLRALIGRLWAVQFTNFRCKDRESKIDARTLNLMRAKSSRLHFDSDLVRRTKSSHPVSLRADYPGCRNVSHGVHPEYDSLDLAFSRDGFSYSRTPPGEPADGVGVEVRTF